MLRGFLHCVSFHYTSLRNDGLDGVLLLHKLPNLTAINLYEVKTCGQVGYIYLHLF